MLNEISIMGRMTRDPELRYTQSGTAVASFTLACDRDFKDANGDRQTDFLDCVAWRQTAEFISKNFSKGSMAVVTGRLQIRDWTDSEGAKRRNAEIMVENIYFGGDKKARAEQTADMESAFAQASAFADIGDDDELPFNDTGYDC